LRSHADFTICKPVNDAITQEALSRIDRMSNKTLMVHSSLRLQEALKEAGPVVVTVAAEGNKRKKIDGEPLSRLTACCITQANCAFFALPMGKRTSFMKQT